MGNNWKKNSNYPENPNCENPIFLDENGVTIKAKNCAIEGKEYTFNGETYYLALSKQDIEIKIFYENFPANKIITSKVNDMSWLFSSKGNFNQDISSWDVSNVTSMNGMFYGANSFNQDLKGWNVSKITSEPNNFASNSPFSNENKPIWGTTGQR